MDLKRFVRIEQVGNNQAGGTGYLISGDRVLTARHVVKLVKAGAVAFQVVFDRGEGEPPGSAPVLEVVWEGEGALDVAVLRVETGLRVPRQLLEGRPVGAEEPAYRSRGWARAAPDPEKAGPSVTDAMSGLSGKVYEATGTANELELTVDAPPDGVEWWKGASGAPVFCGARLVGVVSHGSDVWEGGRLRAVAMSALWPAPGFRAAVGYDLPNEELRERRRQELRGDLARVLERYPKAAEALAAEVDAWGAAYQDPSRDRAEALAQAVCSEASWRHALQAFQRAYDQGTRHPVPDRAQVCEGLVAAVERALPEIYALSEVMPFLGPGGHFFTLPIETATLAEIAMAAHDGQALCFEEVRSKEHFPAGVSLLPLADSAFEGFDFKQQDAFHRWLPLLGQRIGLTLEDRERLQLPGREKDFAQRINQAIERGVKRFGERRHYVAFPPSFRASRSAFLDRVREDLPALHVVELAGLDLVGEREACDPLQFMLYQLFELRKPNP